ncbi:Putative MutT/NUDIX-like protein [Mycobacteroides abscessus subsp. abscessus]|nr:Putative MutT/NUDIX-like protein [Mycobacteroides abscessus subsp. abscessus]
MLGGTLAIDHESTDIAWTAPDEIPNLDMHPSMRLRIEHYLQHRDGPYLG